MNVTYPAASFRQNAVLPPASDPLLTVQNLNVSFRPAHSLRAVVKGVSFTVDEGRCVAIVGESGSGKSVTARTLVGLTGAHSHVQADRLTFQGKNIDHLGDKDWRALRGKRIGFVLQDALVSLDPLRPVGKEIGEALSVHCAIRTRADLTERVVELLKLVGVPEPAVKARQLPHELSGGQRQRALIATAIALDPALLIADEPTTALDVTIQAQIMDLLSETRERGKAMILISHNLAVVSQMADEVIVMRHGEIVEHGSSEQIFGDPRHEYTRGLLKAIPSVRSRGSRLSSSTAPRFISAEGEETKALTQSNIAQRCSPLLEAERLVKRFRGPDGKLRTVVNDVSFRLGHGETLGIVGESGSGKTTVARMALALEKPDQGEVTLEGSPWTAATEKERRQRRSDISVIYQDPLSSFDPRWTIERVIDDALARGPGDLGRANRRPEVSELLDLVGLSPSFRTRRPLELSGGQRQRVAIARAIAPRPRIIVCDEPVAALDVSIQAQILDLLGDLKSHLGVSYLFISHDLGVVHHLSDRVLVMNHGVAVEAGGADDVFLRPRQPYTRKLVAAVPQLHFQVA
ncbi:MULTISPECIES: dipeptide ABC transporter ATP-binding protein [Bradyrhizobium]|uniref:ABC transporter ATP-binding protein n=1 Tax=Bradyrhizobium barranii subsp. barranii TaxID=2823807 RepID=A0A7Z0Q9D9_9BRAD|nr:MULTISPECIES: ABC transporter ATP-binding protein [Bradyrhizobium]MBR1004104.1 ABC transporter ATP-binding protein [Bradyrhizobium liaoningense]MBR1070379.1 ABC transporter ATP-binding protein [Bradyrhizobium liaoningense]MCP1748212.1 peptide/nickel transport system ATP-binding protein [Bradyrhizobium japonicum]MCP1783610.1 peptide/nickel transport system ATP-binding protein [Bradyrhizobium japonicum]MCP1866134.1 peptide/nickel transport system ATP-binding protein [Bradyrhizobium japonicum]